MIFHRFECVAVLPKTFDRNCRKCDARLREEPALLHFPESTFPKPFLQLQCPNEDCKRWGLAFPAPVTPLVVWNSDWYHRYPFSDFFEERMKRHISKHSIRSRFYKNPLVSNKPKRGTYKC